MVIYTICSDNYVEGTSNMIRSFLYYNKWFDGDIVILYSDNNAKLSQDSIQKLSLISNKIKFVIVDDKKYTNGQKIPDRLKATVLKYSFFDNNDDICMFIDSDMLINSDLYNEELFNIGKKYTIFSCVDKEFNLTDTSFYDINTGFIIGNKYTKNVLGIEMFLEYIEKYPNRNFEFGDQTLINHLLKFFKKEKTYYIGNQYNYMLINNFLNYEEKKILHFMQPVKPWMKKNDFINIDNLYFDLCKKF